MKRYWAYLKYVLRHKWFVFVECCKDGMPLTGLLHDMNKLCPKLFVPYARFFYAPDGTKIERRDKSGYYNPFNTGDKAFDLAVKTHLMSNPHHWQYWVLPLGKQEVMVYPMSRKALREMVCDWRGAAKANGTPGLKDWYDKNKHSLVLHDESRKVLEKLI